VGGLSDAADRAPPHRLAKDPEFVAYPLVLLIVDFRLRRWLDSRIGTRGRGLETDVADVKIFLEAIELEEVGEFESADISALCTYFLLEISDYALQVCGIEAGMEELIPEPFAIEAQAKSLSSPAAVKLVQFAHRSSCAMICTFSGSIPISS
jgi:hypothetical protein